MSDASELGWRDKVVKHMKQGPPPERPADYGRQSNRLLGEITDGIREEDASATGRVRLGLRGQFEQLKGGDIGASLIGEMSSRRPTMIAGDQDVFGADMLSRANRRMRLSSNLTGRNREMAEAVSARNDAGLAAAAVELEKRTQEIEAQRMLDEYPDMDPATALFIAGAGDDDDPVAA